MMKCPHCNQEIDSKVINSHFASEGGKRSAEKLTPEQRSDKARKAVQAREARRSQ